MKNQVEEAERRLWTGGAEVFAAVMSDDGVLVAPTEDGVKDKAATLAMLRDVPLPDRIVFANIAHTAIAPGVAAISYRADAEYGGLTLSVFCSSVWRAGDDGLRLALHQQTAAPGSEL